MVTGFGGMGEYLPAKHQCYQSCYKVCEHRTQYYAGFDSAPWSCTDSKTTPPASMHLATGGICWCYVPK